MYIVKEHNDLQVFLSDLKTFDVSENPFLSYSFLSVYFKFFPKGKFSFYYIMDGDEIVGIAPMEYTFESKILNVKKLRFIGYRQFNYEQYIAKEDNMRAVDNALMRYFSQQKYNIVLNLYDINSASTLYEILVNSSYKQKRLQLYCCPYLNLTDSFDELFKTVYSSSKKRAELKKFQRKLEEMNGFKIINVDDEISYDANKKLIDQVYRVHSERFAGVYATSFFGSEKFRPYYSELIKSLMQGKKGFLSLVALDDVVIAFVFCLTNGRILIDWIPAFDPSFSKFSLGIVQYKMLFETLCDSQKYQLFDYSKGSSVYKRKWAKKETFNYQFIVNVNSKSINARLFYYLDVAKYSFKLFLRNKGILEWGKDTLGKLLSLVQKKQKVIDNVIIDYSGNDVVKEFNYSDISSMSLNVRREVVDALYQGAVVTDIIREDGKYRILIKNK